jgi:hypothetical protein
MPALKKTRPFECSYFHDGTWWSLTVHAYDWADAEARSRKLGNLRLDGEQMAVVSAKLGLVARLACTVRNGVRSLASGLFSGS